MTLNKKKLLLWLFLSLPLHSWGLNPAYRFEVVAQSGQTIDGITLYPSFSQPPCINDAGEVAFVGTYQTTPETINTALFADHHVIVKAGDKIDGHVIQQVAGCSLNNAGELLFFAGLHSGKGALFLKQGRSQPRLVAITGESICGVRIDQIGNFALNDFGQIAFVGTYHTSDGSNEVGVFTPSSILLLSSSSVDHIQLYAIDSIITFNTRGLFFHGFSTSIGDGIFSMDRLIAKTGDTISGHTLVPVGTSTFGNLASGSHGTLAFGATYDGGAGVFNAHKELADVGGTLPPTFSINDRGNVLYLGSNGLMVDKAPLINFGDSIAGLVMNGVSLPAAINNYGVVLFRGNFGPVEAIILVRPKR